MRALRAVLLAIIASNLAMIGTRVALDPQLLGLPGGSRSALEPSVMLALVALLVIGATSGDTPSRRALLREGTAAGLVGGAVEVVHITVENFGHLSPRVESASTGGFLLALLLVWAVAGYRAARRTSDLGAGLLAGSWSAEIGMLMAVTYGFSQLFWGLPGLERRNIGSPDLARSGWTDLHTFTIADIFESGFKVLLVAPVAGAILGGLGALAARLIPGFRGREPA